MKKRRRIDTITIDNKMYADNDWRAYICCEDEDGNIWELRAISGYTPEEAIANTMEAFNEEDWSLYGWIVKRAEEAIKTLV